MTDLSPSPVPITAPSTDGHQPASAEGASELSEQSSDQIQSAATVSPEFSEAIVRLFPFMDSPPPDGAPRQSFNDSQFRHLFSHLVTDMSDIYWEKSTIAHFFNALGHQNPVDFTPEQGYQVMEQLLKDFLHQKHFHIAMQWVMDSAFYQGLPLASPYHPLSLLFKHCLESSPSFKNRAHLSEPKQWAQWCIRSIEQAALTDEEHVFVFDQLLEHGYPHTLKMALAQEVVHMPKPTELQALFNKDARAYLALFRQHSHEYPMNTIMRLDRWPSFDVSLAAFHDEDILDLTRAGLRYGNAKGWIEKLFHEMEARGTISLPGPVLHELALLSVERGHTRIQEGRCLTPLFQHAAWSEEQRTKTAHWIMERGCIVKQKSLVTLALPYVSFSPLRKKIESTFGADFIAELERQILERNAVTGIAKPSLSQGEEAGILHPEVQKPRKLRL